MRVAILGTRGIPAQYGGFESFAERLAVGLTEMGFEVTVYCEARSAAPPDQWRGVNLKYISASPALGSFQTIYYDVKSLIAARTGYDVVYMLGYGAALFCFIPRFWGTPTWINPDGLEWARAKWGRLAKLYFRLMEWTSIQIADRIIADSKAIEESLQSRHGSLRASSVIPYGCEVVKSPPKADFLEQFCLTPDQYYLIVCRLEPENHVREILGAFQQSQSRRKLVVVGNRAAGTRYVEDLLKRRDDRIQFIGTVFDSPLLISLRYHSFAYFHGHSVGGTNPSLLEAMGCANFIFAHDNPFNRETLGEAGRFFRSVEDLTRLIDEVDGNPSIRSPFKDAARRRALQYFSWSEIVAKYAALMRSALSGKERER
jgi:glycosyltransferase involved in cell wall biosynthesis